MSIHLAKATKTTFQQNIRLLTREYNLQTAAFRGSRGLQLNILDFPQKCL